MKDFTDAGKGGGEISKNTLRYACMCLFKYDTLTS